MDLLFDEKCIIFVLAKRREPIDKGFSPLFSYENAPKNHCFTKHIEKFICRREISTGFSGNFSGQVGARIDDIGFRKVKRYLFSKGAFLSFRVTTQVVLDCEATCGPSVCGIYFNTNHTNLTNCAGVNLQLGNNSIRVSLTRPLGGSTPRD